MTDDIIDQLSCYVTNEMRMPAGLIVTVINEIEQLRENNEYLKNIIEMLRNEARNERS